MLYYHVIRNKDKENNNSTNELSMNNDLQHQHVDISPNRVYPYLSSSNCFEVPVSNRVTNICIQLDAQCDTNKDIVYCKL